MKKMRHLMVLLVPCLAVLLAVAQVSQAASLNSWVDYDLDTSPETTTDSDTSPETTTDSDTSPETTTDDNSSPDTTFSTVSPAPTTTPSPKELLQLIEAQLNVTK